MNGKVIKNLKIEDVFPREVHVCGKECVVYHWGHDPDQAYMLQDMYGLSGQEWQVRHNQPLSEQCKWHRMK